MSSGTLAKNIRSYRRAAGMTQQELAGKLYIAPQTVSKWESGVSVPDTDRMCIMADIFGISLDALIRSPMESTEEVYVAIDGGGTKTDILLFTRTGEVRRRITLGGCNPNAVGMEEAERVLVEGLDRLISREVRAVGLFAGIAGASSGDNKQVLAEYLRSRYPYMKVRVEGDLHNAVSLVRGVERCIAVIAGTGSAVFGWDGKEMLLVGGWGYLFDDAGSGFGVGREAIRHCLMVEEGELAGGELYRDITAALGGRAHDRLAEIYSGGNDYIASMAPVVFECYGKGDPTAAAIVTRLAERISLLINRLAGMTERDFGDTVVISGGLASAGEVIEPLLAKLIGPSRRIVFTTLPPVYGAAVKCMKLFGRDVDMPEFERTLEASIERNRGK